MSLYGINSYSSNNMYSELLSAKNSGSSNMNAMLSSLTNKKSSSSSSSTYDFLKGIANTKGSDGLQTLAKNVDLVRSKGYQKQMTDEYRKIFSGETTSSSASSGTSSAKANEQALSKAAKGLSSAASKLSGGNSAFYGNSEDLLAGMKDFVSSYNNTIDSLKNSNSTLALQKGVSLVSNTAAYSKSLEKIGITVGSDNKLSLDEKIFAKANEGSVKSLFSGSYSYASKNAEKANYIDRVAQVQQQSTYNSLGKVNSDFLQNAMINTMYSKLF